MRSATTTAPTTIANRSRIDRHLPNQKVAQLSSNLPMTMEPNIPTCFPPSALRDATRPRGSRQRCPAVSPYGRLHLRTKARLQGRPEVSVANDGSMFHGWGGEVDRHENA